MGLLYGFLILVEMLVSALLIAVIFMQKTKGGMGGSAFGGGGAGEAIFGSRMGNVLTKATVVLGIIFLVNTLVLTVMTSRRGLGGGSVMEGASGSPAPSQQQLPMQPPANNNADWMEGELEPDIDGSVPVDMSGDSVDMRVDVPDDVMVVEPAADVMTVDPEDSEIAAPVEVPASSSETGETPPASE